MPGTLLLVNPSRPRMRLYGGTASSMLTRPMSPSLHRSSRPQVRKAGVGSATKRANPKKATKKVAKKPAAKKAAKRSSKMSARKKMARRRVRRNPIDRAASGPGAGQAYRMVKDKSGKMVRKYYSPRTTASAIKKATRKKDASGNWTPPSDLAIDRAIAKRYGIGKKKKKKVAAKKRKAPARRAAPKKAVRRAAPKKAVRRAASPASALRAQAKKMGLKSSGTVAQVKARIAAKKRRAKTKRAPAKKAARKTARRAATKKAVARRRRRRTPSLATIEKRIRSARASARRSKSPRSVARRIHRTRGAALRLQKAARKGALTGKQRAMLRRHGLMRVNPSLKGITQDFIGLLPKAGVTVLATAGIAWGGQKVGDRLKAMSWMPEAVKPFAVPVATGGVTVGAFYAASMIKPLAKFRDAIMFGGLAAVAVHTLAAVKMKKDGAEVSLGQKLGLPIADFVAIDGFGDYIPQSLGRHYGEQLGDFVAIDGFGEAPSPYLDVDGTEIRLNGMFDESSLGEAPQMGYGREPARALDSAGDMTVEDVLAEADSGILAGSVFD